MFGIPTLVTDYSNDPTIFDPNDDRLFKVDAEASRETNLYRLQKAMVAAYRKAGVPNKTAKEVAVRSGSGILDALLNPPPVEVDDDAVVECECSGCACPE